MRIVTEMKRLIPFAILLGVVAAGCANSGGSDLTKEDKQKMDTLFREGIKNPPNAGPDPGKDKGVPINAAPD